MSKFDKEYNKLLLESKLFLENDNETSEDPFKKQNQMRQEQSKQAKAGSFDWISNMILPTLLGLGSASMFFGRGLFGLGKNNKFFGGWGGQLLGGLGLALALPGLWSKKSFGQRLSDGLSKIGDKKILEGIGQLFGISSAADEVLTNGKQQVDKNMSKQQSVEARRNTYIHNIQGGQKILKYLKANGYQGLSDLVIINERISLFLIKPKYQNEIQKYGKDITNGIIATSSKGTRAAMFNPADAVNLINSKFVNFLAAAFTPPTKNEDGSYKNDGNPHLKDKPKMEKGWNALCGLMSTHAKPITWFEDAKTIADGLRSMNVGGLSCVNQLFAGFERLPDIAIPLQINQSDIVKQQEQVSSSDIADTFKNDQSLKDMKQDPVLNRFDQKIKAIDNEIKNIYVDMLKNSIEAANQKDPDGYIIQGKIGDKTVYYARKPENNYLTDNIEETVYFTKQTVEKLEGNGSPELKLQNTLQAIKMPQIMKMKNSGLTLYIKSINLQYMKKVSEVLKNKFNMSI